MKDSKRVINGEKITNIKEVIKSIDIIFIVKLMSLIMFIFPPLLILLLNKIIIVNDITYFVSLDEYIVIMLKSLAMWGYLSWFIFIRTMHIEDYKTIIFGFLFSTFGTYGFIIIIMISKYLM